MNVRSISFRLVSWYIVLLAMIFALLCTLLYWNLSYFLENNLHQTELRRTYQIAGNILVHAQERGDDFVASQTKDWFEPEISGRFVRITRDDGTVVYISGAPKDGSFNPQEIPAISLPAGKKELSQKFKLANDQTILVAAIRYQLKPGPAYTVEFGELLDPVTRMMDHLFLQLALGLPLAIICVAGGGWLLVRRALTPVEHITRSAESITQHNLSERLPVASTGDEIEHLSNALNRMIARLDDAFQNSRRFVADASHELRTPLTILRGELESLIENPQLTPELREKIGNINAEALHLTKIVEQLFMLSRLDAGEAQSSWDSFDLAELARVTADQLNLLAEDKNIVLTCEAKNPVPVAGDRVRLKQVIVNLLDNAIKYTPANGKVWLRVGIVDGNAVLEVQDNGSGIPAEALPHVFERFYRADQVHSSYAESAGLGLAIVKAICSAHGATVDVDSTPGQGSRFRIKLPLSKK